MSKSYNVQIESDICLFLGKFDLVHVYIFFDKLTTSNFEFVARFHYDIALLFVALYHFDMLFIDRFHYDIALLFVDRFMIYQFSSTIYEFMV